MSITTFDSGGIEWGKTSQKEGKTPMLPFDPFIPRVKLKKIHK